MVENIKKSIEKQVDEIFKSANSLYKTSQNISIIVKDQSIIMNQQSERIVGIKATLKELSVSASQIAESSGSVLHIAEKTSKNPKREWRSFNPSNAIWIRLPGKVTKASSLLFN